MDNKNYLSPTEQEVWSIIQENEYIDTELVRMVFPDRSPGHVRKILHSLWKKGRIKRAQRDVYYHPEQSDYWALALHLGKGYLGLSSALRFHNLLDYEDARIFVITKQDRKKVDLGEQDITYIPLEGLYAGFKVYGKYTVSTPEKTIFDCLLKANLVGYGIITKAIFDAKNFDWDAFVSYFRLSKNKALHQRTGYILDLLQSETHINVPKHTIAYFRVHIGNKVKIGDGKTTFHKEWNIEDGLGKEGMLGWWH